MTLVVGLEPAELAISELHDEAGFLKEATALKEYVAVAIDHLLKPRRSLCVIRERDVFDGHLQPRHERVGVRVHHSLLGEVAHDIAVGQRVDLADDLHRLVVQLATHATVVVVQHLQPVARLGIDVLDELGIAAEELHGAVGCSAKHVSRLGTRSLGSLLPLNRVENHGAAQLWITRPASHHALLVGLDRSCSLGHLLTWEVYRHRLTLARRRPHGPLAVLALHDHARERD